MLDVRVPQVVETAGHPETVPEPCEGIRDGGRSGGNHIILRITGAEHADDFGREFDMSDRVGSLWHILVDPLVILVEHHIGVNIDAGEVREYILELQGTDLTAPECADRCQDDRNLQIRACFFDKKSNSGIIRSSVVLRWPGRESDLVELFCIKRYGRSDKTVDVLDSFR